MLQNFLGQNEKLNKLDINISEQVINCLINMKYLSEIIIFATLCKIKIKL